MKSEIQIQLFDGSFSNAEAADLLTKMIQLKIAFHESKIEFESHEEDIKMRESKIRFLQDQIAALQKELFNLKTQKVRINGAITVS
jgi:predicted  nucleic acid-binding Zn-ribbon protein